LMDFGFDQINNSAAQNGTTPVVPHDYLSLHVKINQKGYLYVYLSNEVPGGPSVYFDDLKIVQYSAVEQVNDYYPFGLTFNSYARESSIGQNYLYNGKERQDELGLEWMDYGWRMYSPDIARFFSIDPHADSYNSWTPYNYVSNNPVLLIDPDGRDWIVNRSEKDGKVTYDIKFTATLVNKSESKNMKVSDLITLANSLQNQIHDALTIDEENVSTNVSVDIAFSKDGKARDGDHVFEVVDDLNKGTAGEVDPDNPRNIKLSSSHVFEMGSNDDAITGPHEAGHSAGLHHPEDGIVWYNVWTWFNHAPEDQQMSYSDDPDNVMFTNKYRFAESNSETTNNNGKGYKINGNQARIIYENRDNKPKKK
jgi:RHS repeat-associated protein